MPKIYIDDVPFEIRPGQNLLEAGLSLGLNIPYFCWHPALGSAGACRQCAVKQYANESDTKGRLVMACMTPCSEGARFSLEDAEAKEFRAGVVELLMANHPHDCPVCDEGGECHLQDMTVMTGHNYRDYRFPKRTFENQDLGPLINHEMNRCIQCYRCVRYYRDYAGGEDLQAFASKNHVYFGRQQSGTLESEFSGNLVEVCPTGVFTDKTLKKHYTRRWDLATAPSVCVHCAVGCNTFPGERYGSLRRIRNRYNGEVNGYFLCDRGRYGYEFVNAENRIRQTQRRRDGGFEPIARGEALAELAGWLADPAKVVAVGSPRASLEDNFALRRLVGAENFSSGLAARDARLLEVLLECLQTAATPTPSLRQIREAEAVVILGEDVLQVAPMVALEVRQASRNLPLEIARKAGIPEWNDLAVREIVQDEKGPLVLATPGPTKLDELATERLFLAPEDIARFGFALAAALDPAAPAVAELPAALQAAAERAAAALRPATRVVVISGPSLGSEALLRSATALAGALHGLGKEATLALLPGECNSLSLAFLGGQPLEAVLELFESGAAETLVVDQNDLFRRMSREAAERLFAAARRVVVIDHTPGETTGRADLLFPASTFAEGDGTYINYEGRAQRFVQVYVPSAELFESWRWVRDLGAALGRADLAGWSKLDDVVDAIAGELPCFASLGEVAPDASFRIRGLKIPRQSHRASGRTAMKAHLAVSEGAVPVDPDSPLSFSMEGYLGAAPPALTPFFWAPGWNSASSITRFQEEIGGPLRGGDPGLRLIEVEEGAAPPTGAVPAAFAPRPDELLLLPLAHIFGSEELSAHAPGIAKLAPAPYLLVAAATAAERGWQAGQAVEVELAGYPPLALPLAVAADFPAGCAGLPAGLPGCLYPTLPAWGKAQSLEAR